MVDSNPEDTLTKAVTTLTGAVQQLDKLLRDEYPKRSEVQNVYATKLENQKIITKVIIMALISVLACYGVTVGIYSRCFTGDESLGLCEAVPGYDARIERRNEIDDRLDKHQAEINRLQNQTGG